MYYTLRQFPFGHVLEKSFWLPTAFQLVPSIAASLKCMCSLRKPSPLLFFVGGWVCARQAGALPVLFVVPLRPTTHHTNFFLTGGLYGAMRSCGELAQPWLAHISESRTIWERNGPITFAAIKTCMICDARPGN